MVHGSILYRIITVYRISVCNEPSICMHYVIYSIVVESTWGETVETRSCVELVNCFVLVLETDLGNSRRLG